MESGDSTSASEAEDATSKTLEADRIYVLMQKDYRSVYDS